MTDKLDLSFEVERYVHNGGVDSVSHEKIKNHLHKIGLNDKTVDTAMSHLTKAANEQSALLSRKRTADPHTAAVLGLLGHTGNIHIDRFHSLIKKNITKNENVEMNNINEGTIASKSQYVKDFEVNHPKAKEDKLETHSYIGDHGPADMSVYDENTGTAKIRHIITHLKEKNRIHHQQLIFQTGSKLAKGKYDVFDAKTGKKLVEETEMQVEENEIVEESFTSKDFIDLLMDGHLTEAQEMFQLMIESETVAKVEEFTQTVAESMFTVSDVAEKE